MLSRHQPYFNQLILTGVAIACAAAVSAQAPSVVTGGVLNAGSFAKDSQGHGTAVAPGSLVSIFGSFPGATVANADSIPYSTSLGGITVTFNNVQAPLQNTVPTGAFPFINAQLPFEALASGKTSDTVQVVVTIAGVASAPIAVPLVLEAPGIFTIPATGLGNAVLVTTDAGPNFGKIAAPNSAAVQGYPAAPILRGANAFFYVTGLGAMIPPVPDGSGGADGVEHDAVKPTVTLGGITCPVLYSGASGYPGVYQINITIPQGAPSGSAVPLIVISPDGTVISNTSTVAVQ